MNLLNPGGTGTKCPPYAFERVWLEGLKIKECNNKSTFSKIKVDFSKTKLSFFEKKELYNLQPVFIEY